MRRANQGTMAEHAREAVLASRATKQPRLMVVPNQEEADLAIGHLRLIGDNQAGLRCTHVGWPDHSDLTWVWAWDPDKQPSQGASTPLAMVVEWSIIVQNLRLHPYNAPELSGQKGTSWELRARAIQSVQGSIEYDGPIVMVVHDFNEARLAIGYLQALAASQGLASNTLPFQGEAGRTWVFALVHGAAERDEHGNPTTMPARWSVIVQVAA